MAKEENRINDRQRLEKKLAMIRNGNSFVLFFDKINMVAELFKADKTISEIRSSLVMNPKKMPIAIDIFSKYSQKAEECFSELINFLSEIGVISNFWSSKYSLADWGKFNDSFQEKEMLAQRRNTVVFIPHSEEAAKWAALIKQAHKSLIELKNLITCTPENLVQYGELCNKIVNELRKLNKEALKAFNALNKLPKEEEKEEEVEVKTTIEEV